VAARLERHEHRGPEGAGPGVLERDDLGVRPAGPLVMALTDDHPVGGDDDGADHRIRGRHALGARRVEQRAPHHRQVVHQPALNSAWM
jgi:hypothetical protein